MPLHDAPLNFEGLCNHLDDHVIFHVMVCNNSCNYMNIWSCYIISFTHHYTHHYIILHAIIHELHWGYMVCYIHITHCITWPVTQATTWIITLNYIQVTCSLHGPLHPLLHSWLHVPLHRITCRITYILQLCPVITCLITWSITSLLHSWLHDPLHRITYQITYTLQLWPEIKRLITWPITFPVTQLITCIIT